MGQQFIEADARCHFTQVVELNRGPLCLQYPQNVSPLLVGYATALAKPIQLPKNDVFRSCYKRLSERVAPDGDQTSPSELLLIQESPA